ncbi:uncharacterized protein AKAME5_002987800 [Lates japonicus]|uniref:Uncharacterized protein n=1 Tax=Lates japonicus TaxID=270547 RepID=A0AAD3MPC3_LATJO|nr:uncharacterized protein AKAME5_002987600 [Lates japonicus]GLD57197.1 uncharacterized protein AKAME5_002987800 [Lates japonicus]
MTYLGQGHRGSGLVSAQDELKVLQQVNGGENICVFKGLVTPGAQTLPQGQHLLLILYYNVAVRSDE